MIVPVILSGGAGTRLWPLSRELYPKQLLPLVSERTMLEETVLRIGGLPDLGRLLAVCNEEHRFMVAEQLRQAGADPSAIILEPVGRNTAPAVALAAIQATADGSDPLLLVLPADHVIRDSSAFRAAVLSGIPAADAGRLVTFGIVPDQPETGYGYIRADRSRPFVGPTVKAPGTAGGDQGLGAGDNRAFAVGSFVEKPDRATAEAYLLSGEYFWNSGMFLFRARSYLLELERLAPAIYAACSAAMAGARSDLDFTRIEAAAFAACPGVSIDYAVMENTREAVVVPLAAGWSDVGSWAALWAVGEQDGNGNVCRGDVVAVDSHNCYLHAASRLVATVGLTDCVVVETGDAVLVAAKERVQDVKQVVSRLKAGKRGEALLHRRVNRPWGAYECIDAADRFQVKRITVNPGATLSLQLHHHRAEHWIVVKGTARVVRGDEVLTVSENQSTYIPLGSPHRLENPGKIPLELIEVQSGSYLGEDDIVRMEDKYGR